MLRINFEKPLKALEIREPVIDTMRVVAGDRDLYLVFDQSQQRALDGQPGSRGRNRIGNGKHKTWRFNFQTDPTNVSRPNVVGCMALKAPYYPGFNQFGGFDYGDYPKPAPTYDYVDAMTYSEYYGAPSWNGRFPDPDPEIVEAVYRGLGIHFGIEVVKLSEQEPATPPKDPQETSDTLFDVSAFDL